MSTGKRGRLWASALKELKYFETQTELFSACIASLASAKQNLIISMGSRKFTLSDVIERDIFNQTSNGASILSNMGNTLSILNRESALFLQSVQKDDLIFDSIKKTVDALLSNCTRHWNSCKESFLAMINDDVLSESKAKSLVALVMHRPFLFEAQRVQVPDVESLLGVL